MPILPLGPSMHWPLPAPGRPLDGSPPQQSLSVKQRSPVTWQPLAGWQIGMPAGPGAHKRLQQSPQPVQSTPSTLVQYEGPAGGGAQVPTVFPVAIVQSAAQQSLSCAQLSPGWI